MPDFSIKEASDLLEQTPQNIYKKFSVLQKNGMATVNANGEKVITEGGINYLRELKINSIKKNNTKKEQEEQNKQAELENIRLQTENEIYKKQIEGIRLVVSKFDWNVVEREAFAIKFNVWVSLVAFFTFISATFVPSFKNFLIS